MPIARFLESMLLGGNRVISGVRPPNYPKVTIAMCRSACKVIGYVLLVSFLGCGPQEPSPPGPDSPEWNHRRNDPDDNPLAPTVTVYQLIAELPEDSRPYNSGDAVRMEEANEWLKNNAVGKQIEQPYQITRSQSEVNEDGSATVTFERGTNAIAFDGGVFRSVAYRVPQSEMTPSEKSWGLYLFRAGDWVSVKHIDTLSAVVEKTEAKRLLDSAQTIKIVSGTVKAAKFEDLFGSTILTIVLENVTLQDASKEFADAWGK